MFRIKFIQFYEHPIFKNNIFNLSKGSLNSNIYKSIIIGSNGTGKSMLLKEICDIFIAVIANIEQKRNDISVDFDFKLIYENDKKDYIIEKIESKIINFNNVNLEFLPKQVLALSYNLNDKYPLLTKKNKNFTIKYKYLGIKSTTNNAFISKHRKDFIENLNIIFKDKNNKLDILNNFFIDMNLPKKYLLHISYGKNYTKLFPENYMNLNIDDIVKKVVESNAKRSSKRFSDAKFEQFSKNEDLQDLVNTFYKKKLIDLKNNKNVLSYDIDISNNTKNIDFIDDYSIIEELMSMEVLKLEELEIVKRNNYAYNNSSSGEFHLINSITSIISNIENNSLILIDEPEVSLHPNWQLKYIELLDNILSNYLGCHIIISTHSHFLITNLKSKDSFVLSTKRDKDNNQIMIKEINYDTFGWSAENILYNVFDVVTTRNHYFEMDIRKLITYISNNELSKVSEIEKYLNKFKSYNLTSNDPLITLINQAENFIHKVKK